MVNLDRLVWLHKLGETEEARYRPLPMYAGRCLAASMINDMRIEASNYDDVEIIIKDAQNNNETQIQQIRDLIRQKVDVLIISPYQSEPITQLPRKRTVPESRRSLQIAR